MDSNSESDSPKVFTQLECAAKMATTGQSSSETSADQPMHSWPEPSQPTHTEPEAAVHSDHSGETGDHSGYQLQCLESGDGTDYALLPALNAFKSKKAYNPSLEAREEHNHKERLRRSRMKCSCDALRVLVPGLHDKTDKATVLEHTVHFLFHLSKCAGVNCKDYVPITPPPMSAKLLELYPTLLTGEYQYLETISSANEDFDPNSGQMFEMHEQNGSQYVTDANGYQYLVIDSTNAQLVEPMEQTTDQTEAQPMDTNTNGNDSPMSMDVNTAKDEVKYEDQTGMECRKCVIQVVDMLSDDKENIDPMAPKPRKRRPYRKRQTNKDKMSVDSPDVPNSGDNCPVVASNADSGLKKKRKPRQLKPKVF